MQLFCRECDSSDLDTLAQVSKETFAAAFEKDNDPEDFQAYIGQAFHPDTLKKELSNEHCYFYFVFDEGELLGYFKLNIASAQTDVHDPNALELERIYVLESHQGKKVGSWMLKEIIRKAKTLGKDYIWLGVWEHNPKAIAFYLHHGFSKFGEHPYYIGTDKQTDWLLRLNVQ
ncbi:GNAT family N-acetyltransferase [Flagellimonas crocea]|uniref:GNAT family N-acetyltransferase n=1 Tax=Flagellimonas crocea TaxID=3067311 RepID=UPI00296FD11E|nr:GNAT family N-acetyltransferase [Muricauda sp. DH64]